MSCFKITENNFGANLAIAAGNVAAAADCGGACEFTNEFTNIIADNANKTIEKFAIFEAFKAKNI